MKVTDLKDWDKLTPEEQARLRDVYNVGTDDELHIEKTLHDTNPASLKKAKEAIHE